MRQKQQKAQGAIELLMTYAWVLITIVIAGGAILVLASVTPPSACSGFSKLVYKDHVADSAGNFDLVLVNGEGQDINIESIIFEGDFNGHGRVNPTLIAAGGTFAISGNVGALQEGLNYSGAVVIKYLKGGAAKTEKGICTGKRERGKGLCKDVNCDDANLCTVDSCSGGECTNISVPDGANCGFEMECQSGGCVPPQCKDMNCDDANPCTADGCSNGKCTNTPVPDGTDCGVGIAGWECKEGLCVEKEESETGAILGTYQTDGKPRAIAFDPKTNSIWVVNHISNTLQKFRASDGELLGTYSTAPWPTGIVYDPSTNSIWVSNWYALTVQKFSAADGTLVGTYSTFFGTSPWHMAFDPSTNSIWVGTMGGLTKIRASDGNVLGTYELVPGGGYGGVAFDYSTNSIWVTKYSSNMNTLSKLQASDGNIIGVYEIGINFYSEDVVYDSITDSVWVANTNGPSISKFNAADGSLIGTYDAETTIGGIALDPVSKSIWVTNTNRKLRQYSIYDGGLLGVYPIASGGSLRSAVFDSHTNSVWVATYESGGPIFKVKN